jgi:(p)ppGpp synthase/HD superfamily hydrolase
VRFHRSCREVAGLDHLLDLARATYPESDVSRIRSAYEFAAGLHRGQHRRSGDPYITHPIAVATLAVVSRARPDLVCAALLHDVLAGTSCSAARLRAEFGGDIAAVVAAVTVLDQDVAVTGQRRDGAAHGTAAYDRYPADVLVLKVLDRLHNLRTIGYLPLHRQYAKARQTRQVIAPLAADLGMTSISDELNQLARDVLRPAFRGTALSTCVLDVTAVMLPRAQRERWRAEWAGELNALPTRRARGRFVAQTLRGAPRLAVALRRPLTPTRRS